MRFSHLNPRYVLIKHFRKVTPVLSLSKDLNELEKDDRRNLYVLGLPFSLTKWVTFISNAIFLTMDKSGTTKHVLLLRDCHTLRYSSHPG